MRKTGLLLGIALLLFSSLLLAQETPPLKQVTLSLGLT